MARETGIEPATSTVTGWYSNQLSYSPATETYQFCFAVHIIYTAFFENSRRILKKIKVFLTFFDPGSVITPGSSG